VYYGGGRGDRARGRSITPRGRTLPLLVWEV